MKNVFRRLMNAVRTAGCCMLVAAVCAWFGPPSPAAAANGDADSARREGVAMLQKWLRADFELPAVLKLDDALRRDAQALADAHIARMGKVIETWAAEEAALLGANAGYNEIAPRLVARYANESALWQLDSTGADFDRVMLRSLQNPGGCPFEQLGATSFARMVLTVQRMPPADRAVALDAQHVLLARWGAERGAIPARPEPAMLDLAQQAVERIRAPVRASDEPPLTPNLALLLLRPPYRPLPAANRCELVGWWLRREAAGGRALPPDSLTAARYALIPSAQDSLGHLVARRSEPDGYPPLAGVFRVEGSVHVGGRARASGVGFDQPVVRKRAVSVPGIRNVRPVAFETIFDDASLARVATMKTGAAAAGESVEVEIKWAVEP